MARAFGGKTSRFTITAANTPQKISATTLFTDAFRVFAGKANAGDIAVGVSTVTVDSGAATDGEPLAKGEGLSFDISARNASFGSEFDLNSIYVVGSVMGDEVIVTYIEKVD